MFCVILNLSIIFSIAGERFFRSHSSAIRVLRFCSNTFISSPFLLSSSTQNNIWKMEKSYVSLPPPWNVRLSNKGWHNQLINSFPPLKSPSKQFSEATENQRRPFSYANSTNVDSQKSIFPEKWKGENWDGVTTDQGAGIVYTWLSKVPREF